MNIHEFNREKVLAIFDEKIEIGERCKGVHCVDLGGSFPTRIYLQKSASIQPRTSPSKFGEKFNSLFTSLLSCDLKLAHVEPTLPKRRLIENAHASTPLQYRPASRAAFGS